MKKPSHVQQIEAALKAGEKLTGLDILNRFHCLNYKGRIHDLRRKGLPIHTQMVKLENGKEIAQYSIKKQFELKL